MKRPVLFFFALGGLLLGSALTVSAQTALRKTVSAYIAKQAKDQDAAEYRPARKIVLGDLNGDGAKDAAVQYTLEGMGGGNNFAQMLVVFINRKGAYKLAAEELIGSKMSERTATLTGITKGRIALKTEACPEPPQGICGNPKKGTAAFVLRGGRLSEL